MIFTQEKYCEECAAWYNYETVGAPDDTVVCPINPEHITRDSVIIRISESTEMNFNAFVFNDESYGYKVCKVSAGQHDIGTFKIPENLGELLSIKLILLSKVDITDGDFYVKIKKHLIGGSVKADETNWAKKISVVDGVIYGYDLSEFFIDVVAGQYCSVRLQNLTGLDIGILSVDIKYKINENYYEGS